MLYSQRQKAVLLSHFGTSTSMNLVLLCLCELMWDFCAILWFVHQIPLECYDCGDVLCSTTSLLIGPGGLKLDLIMINSVQTRYTVLQVLCGFVIYAPTVPPLERGCVLQAYSLIYDNSCYSINGFSFLLPYSLIHGNPCYSINGFSFLLPYSLIYSNSCYSINGFSFRLHIVWSIVTSVTVWMVSLSCYHIGLIYSNPCYIINGFSLLLPYWFEYWLLLQ